MTEASKRQHLAALYGNQQFISEAPVFLAWCADVARLDRACQLQGYIQDPSYVENFLVAAVDTALAAQNAALAVESMGLGICYIGAIRNNASEEIALLKLPRLTFPLIGMMVGWPSRAPHLRPRLSLKTILDRDHYDSSQEDEALNEYDLAMIATEIYKGRQVQVPREDWGDGKLWLAGALRPARFKGSSQRSV